MAFAIIAFITPLQATNLFFSIILTITQTAASNWLAGNSTFTLAFDANIYLAENDANSALDFLYIQQTSVSVTIPSSGFATIASSFALDCANLPSGVKAYKVSEVTASSATLVEVTEAVAAGTGLILEGTAGSYEIPVVASGTDISASNKLQAAVTATAVAANDAYVLYSGEFCLVTEAGTVPAGKAYLLASDVPAAFSARPLTIEIGDKATGINKVQGEEVQGSLFRSFFSIFFDISRSRNLEGRRLFIEISKSRNPEGAGFFL